MQPGKGGICPAAKAPADAAIEYRPGDILISNIRPYFQKIWYADRNGGCSADVLCIRAKENADSRYLYYLLSQQAFFDYVMSGAKGCKMPRGDKKQIMQWPVTLPPLAEQQRIAAILGALDDKIELNRRINANLEEQAKALFRELLYNYSSGKLYPLNKFANINPYRKITTGACARHIEMANLPTKGPFPANWTYKKFSGGAKFQNGDTLIARITPCLENGKAAYINCLDINEVAFGSTEYIVISAKEKYCPALFYFLVRDSTFIDYAVGHMNGSSGRQRISGNDIERYLVPEITQELSNKFAELAMPIMATIKNNSFENRKLAALRDALLPKLMRGEIMLG